MTRSPRTIVDGFEMCLLRTANVKRAEPVVAATLYHGHFSSERTDDGMLRAIAGNQQKNAMRRSVRSAGSIGVLWFACAMVEVLYRLDEKASSAKNRSMEKA